MDRQQLQNNVLSEQFVSLSPTATQTPTPIFHTFTSPTSLLSGFGNHLNILVDRRFLLFTGFGHSQFFRGLFFLLLYTTGFGIFCKNDK